MKNRAMAWLLNGGYWGMSYRGRFWFDLFMTPAICLLLWWVFRPSDLTEYWFVGVLIAVGVTSAAYNYARGWRGASAADEDAMSG